MRNVIQWNHLKRQPGKQVEGTRSQDLNSYSATRERESLGFRWLLCLIALKLQGLRKYRISELTAGQETPFVAHKDLVSTNAPAQALI